MKQKELTAAAEDLIYLAACAVNGNMPDPDRIGKMNFDHIYEAAQFHSLTAAAGMALESAGIRNEAFIQAAAKSMRKNALLDADRKQLFRALDEAGIWHMALKGPLVMNLYPRYGMRQMADNDILVDAARADDVGRILEGFGFTAESTGEGHHDVYHKPPVSNFEIHRMLFDGHVNDEPLSLYYRDVEKRLLPDRERPYEKHFTPEDLYLYLVAHEYKHYRDGGTGLRSLLDIHVFLRHYGTGLDMDYVAAEAGKMGMAGFEQQNRELAVHLFSGNSLSAAEQEMLSRFVSCGAYGTHLGRTENRVNAFGGGRRGKIRYFMSRLFMPMETIRWAYPVVYRHRILLPFLYIYRIGRGLTVRRAVTMADLRSLKKIS